MLKCSSWWGTLWSGIQTTTCGPLCDKSRGPETKPARNNLKTSNVTSELHQFLLTVPHQEGLKKLWWDRWSFSNAGLRELLFLFSWLLYSRINDDYGGRVQLCLLTCIRAHLWRRPALESGPGTRFRQTAVFMFTVGFCRNLHRPCCSLLEIPSQSLFWCVPHLERRILTKTSGEIQRNKLNVKKNTHLCVCARSHSRPRTSTASAVIIQTNPLTDPSCCSLNGVQSVFWA